MVLSRIALFVAVPLALAVTACGPGGGGGAGNPDTGKSLFASKGCGSCHTLAAVPGATGTVGPPLDHIATTAATRKPGTSAEAYIRESISDPQAFIVPGFPQPSPMPSGLASGQELNDLVAFLMTQN